MRLCTDAVESATPTSAVTRRAFTASLAGSALVALQPQIVAAASAKGEAMKQPMLQRPIPMAGKAESLPVIGMGTWNTFDVGATPAERSPLAEVLQVFYQSGARVIDSSPMYGRAEAVSGELITQLEQQAGTFIATKVWTSGVDKGVAQIDQSMRLLKTQRLDLLQIHNLVDWRAHALTLRNLKERGRIRYSGVTHYTVASYEELESVLRSEPFDFVQFNYSLATREAERRLLPFCQDKGIAVLINRPFEEGSLFTRVAGRKVPAYAREIGCTTWAQFFLKFIISHPAVTCVIPATSRVAHMRDNVQAGFGKMPDAKLRERMAHELDRK